MHLHLLLSDRARVKAPALFEEMEIIAASLTAGGPFSDLHTVAVKRLEAAGFTDIEYLDLRAADDLTTLEAPTHPARLFAAAWLAGVRLIDNIAVE